MACNLDGCRFPHNDYLTMAYLFEVAVELGQQPRNVSCLKSFNNVVWKLSDGTKIDCALDSSPSNLWTASDKNWWLRIAPKGISMTGGARRVTSDAMLVEVAKHMYATLQKCSGFRFALVGWEVAESIEVKELLSKPSDSMEIPAGVVVSQNLLKEMGEPSCFVAFGAETFWKPLKESDYLEMVKLFGNET